MDVMVVPMTPYILPECTKCLKHHSAKGKKGDKEKKEKDVQGLNPQPP